jgi:hypothetical protein
MYTAKDRPKAVSLMMRSLVYECDVKKAAEQDQHPNAPTKRYPIVCRHGNLAGCILHRSTGGVRI